LELDAVRRDNGEKVFQSLIGFKINWNFYLNRR